MVQMKKSRPEFVIVSTPCQETLGVNTSFTISTSKIGVISIVAKLPSFTLPIDHVHTALKS